MIQGLGTGTCARPGNALECEQRLSGVDVDREQARASMLADGLSPEHVENRLAVVDVFAKDRVVEAELSMLESTFW